MPELSDNDQKLGALVDIFMRQMSERKLDSYAPYEWQKEFHAAGEYSQERMLMAANRVGKTASAAAEVTLHLTGEYDALSRKLTYPEVFPNGEVHPLSGQLVWPNGWEGRRFEHPVLVWTGSPTNETSRDIVQAELLGGVGQEYGTGLVPRRKLIGAPLLRQAGVRNVVDSFQVRHASGGVSVCMLKTYEQGWQKWQGRAPHIVWLDEEPEDYMIYSEAQTRILTTHGIVMVTFTPLSGVTELVEHFQKGGQGVYLKGATWADAPHLAKEDRDRLARSYRAHERDARTQGVPMLGEGAVFPVSDDLIRVQPFKVPDHFARLKGCDFGIDHPAAGVEIAWDRDQDVIYVIDCYRQSDKTVPYHAAWFNKSNRGIPVAWPHDGMNRERQGGGTIADIYRSHKVAMLPKSARYPRAPGDKAEKAGAQPIEPIISEMLERMTTGRLKVFANCSLWLEEKRSYHRKDGRIVDRRDDILKATAYAIMMKRYAVALENFRARYSDAPTSPIATARV